MLPLTPAMLLEMQSVDLLTVDRSTLVDIKNVQLDPNLPQMERMLSYMEQIKNPYCYQCGKTVVKVKYSEKENTLEELLIRYFQGMV